MAFWRFRSYFLRKWRQSEALSSQKTGFPEKKKTGNRIPNSRKRIISGHILHQYAKFGADPFSRLGSRAVHTDRQTDGKADWHPGSARLAPAKRLRDMRLHWSCWKPLMAANDRNCHSKVTCYTPWSAVVFDDNQHFDVKVQGLPDENYEEISKNFEETDETEFCALHNGSNIMELGWIP